MHKIYIITNYINRKVYIGKTSRLLSRRFFEHVYKSNKKANSLLCRAIKKYGANAFTISILSQFNSEKEALEFEIYKIKEFNSNNKSFGYNITAGGQGMLNPNVNTRFKIGSGKRGKQNSEETRKKISNALIGKPAWNKGLNIKINDALLKYIKENPPWNKGIRKRTGRLCKCGRQFHPPKESSTFCSKSCATKFRSVYFFENNLTTSEQVNNSLNK